MAIRARSTAAIATTGLPPMGDTETIRFGLRGKGYEIDLRAPDARRLRRALEDFVSGSGRSSASSSASATVAELTAAKVEELLTSRTVAAPELADADPTLLAERMIASIPTRHVYDALVGPFYDTTGLRNWLGLTRQALASRVRAGSLLACPTQDNQLVYPAWQFRADGSTVPHLAEVIKILRRSASSPWTIATWLRSPDSQSTDGLDAVSWLNAGGDVQVIIEAARDDAARWAS